MPERNEALPVLDYELSLAVALSTGAVPNYCYANAYHALEAMAEWSGVCLVEGWIALEQATQVTVIEHCWCERKTPGRNKPIIDPSIVLVVRQGLARSVSYFPGIRRDRAEIQTRACRDLPSVKSSGTYGPDGFGHTEYLAAYEAASAQATHLASAFSPRKLLVIQPSAFPARERERLNLVIKIASSQNFLRPNRE